MTIASTPQIQTKDRAKTQTKKICLTQDIQQTKLEVLKKESQKLDLEIENLLLAKKKLKLEIMEIEERTGLSIRVGSRPKQPSTDQPLAGYFRLILLLILVRNLK